MAVADATLVATATSPSISASLTNPDGTVFSLVGATVRFLMRLTTAGALQVDAPAVVVTDYLGAVRYDFAAGDLVAGDYESRWQISWLDGSVEFTDPPNTITVEAI